MFTSSGRDSKLPHNIHSPLIFFLTNEISALLNLTVYLAKILWSFFAHTHTHTHTHKFAVSLSEQLVLKICFTCILLLFALLPAWDADLMGKAVVATL